MWVIHDCGQEPASQSPQPHTIDRAPPSSPPVCLRVSGFIPAQLSPTQAHTAAPQAAPHRSSPVCLRVFGFMEAISGSALSVASTWDIASAGKAQGRGQGRAGWQRVWKGAGERRRMGCAEKSGRSRQPVQPSPNQSSCGGSSVLSVPQSTVRCAPWLRVAAPLPSWPCPGSPPWRCPCAGGR